jgi:hypothetical protein
MIEDKTPCPQWGQELADVRFASESGQIADVSVGPLSARNGYPPDYSITSSVVASSVGGTARPSVPPV